MQKIICIYKLNFKGTDKVYIGQSSDFVTRIHSHLTLLKNGKSPKKLQEAFNIYGVPIPEILIECSIEELDDLEEQAIEVYDSVNNGFNTMYSFGHRSTLKGELAGNAKYSNQQVIEAFSLLVYSDYSHKEITNITGISRGALSDISRGATHVWLKDDFPEDYVKLISKKGVRRSDSINRVLGAEARGIVYPTIISPEGIEYNVKALRQFCREHNLNHGPVGTILRQGWGQHKGWKVKS